MKIIKSKRYILILLAILLFILIGCSNQHTYINEELKSKITESNIIQSTVLIVKEQKETSNDSATSITYSYGFSGGIIKKEENKYYILTAFHPIEQLTDENLIVLLWNEPRYNDLPSEQKKGISRYYASKSKAKIEYTDIKYDLAIISFESGKELPILEISDTEAMFGDDISSISNPKDRDRNYLSFGKITSKIAVPFGDDKDNIQYNVIEHNSYINEGSSGSILINNDLKVVGINLGGTTRRDKFIKAKAMPLDRIIEFINKSSI
ncbi:S1 family peptidase [Haploplasma axanthum]|uniref:Peptidase Do n=1 Tax=Haploplasma axanthum TaxID=29552 RepID=A0A449BE37_HAPAX|nr:serine protease [Haploplasma axanthum]VEU80570.1 peptidase Do [Haploplasma axanthum]